MVGALPSMLHVLYSIPNKDPFSLGKERERRGEKGGVTIILEGQETMTWWDVDSGGRAIHRHC